MIDGMQQLIVAAKFNRRRADGNAISREKKGGMVVKWYKTEVPLQVKLLFLLDNGDKSTGNTDTEKQQNEKAAQEVLSVFNTFLSNGNDKSALVKVLDERALKVRNHVPILVFGDSKAADHAVRKADEDVLTFVHACQYLGIKYQNLDAIKLAIERKMKLHDTERSGNFFIFAENLRMTSICDQLSHEHVYVLYDKARNDQSLKNIFNEPLDVSLEKLLQVTGLKEALFLYIIRSMEVNDKLNRIYTHKLEELLNKVLKSILEKENQTQEEVIKDEQTIKGIIENLSTYPMECQPAGLCVVFCVTENRDGARAELDKVTNVFRNSLGFTVKVEEDPTSQSLVNYKLKLSRKKYKFYDSIVFWFMSHGTETEIKLCDKNHKIQDIIDDFSKLDNFRKKPKIFFVASCKGEKQIDVRRTDSGRYDVDGLPQPNNEKYINIPDGDCNITAVYYEMDRLVAHATLPNKFAFRHRSGGSVYVDTVCRLLEEHKGANITQVLEKTCNKMHQILFNCEEQFSGEAKQACFYESTFQKTFNVPSKG
ncbi:hypothetical protein SK128_015821 [Halocaridina rubra]|uniref:Caspase-8 n=1 Tax=Halocaridina rubra TaxID=373956 RepID=A0AAN8X9I2_HALRR